MEGATMSDVTTWPKLGRQRDTDRYLELVRQFPLRPIRTKREYVAATKAMEKLAIRGEDDLNDDERDYLDVLTDLIEAYDNDRYPEAEDGTPLNRLKALLDESSMNTADLGRLLGNSGLASQIMLGRRQLSKTHIRVLSRHFKLDADYFL
jgi:HTH-type transcriptional regulator / antitoxin HigA